MEERRPGICTTHGWFRQYSSAQGRWMSPDPYDGSYDLSSPQSLNRYSYALNNPLAFVDPSGLELMMACDEDGNCEVYDDGGGGGGDGGGGGGGGVLDGGVTTVYVTADPPGMPDLWDSPSVPCDLYGCWGLPSAGFGTSSAPLPKAPNNPYQMIKCTGVGRGLAGNTNLVGRQGGIPG